MHEIVFLWVVISNFSRGSMPPDPPRMGAPSALDRVQIQSAVYLAPHTEIPAASDRKAQVQLSGGEGEGGDHLL